MEFRDQLRAQVDIVQLIGEYVKLKRASAHRYTGLCPFHTEKTPSFSVNTNLQIYKCFGCGAGGDMFKFIMDMENVGFYDALKLIAERHGIPVPRRTAPQDPESRLREALLEMHEEAATVFREHLRSPSGAEARAYLEKRGVSPQTAVHFGLGYSDRGGHHLLKRLEGKFPPDQLRESGLVLSRDSGGYYDRFRGRLMFPIHNESGKVIAFGGRALGEEQPKYLNSSESPIYRKSTVLYNLHRAKQGLREQALAILVEGYMDVIGVASAGFPHVVASCGTALTPAQVKAVKRHSENIVVNFDPDPAGAKAAERSIQMLLDEGMHVRILQLPGALDPDEYIRQATPEAYAAELAKAPGYFIWLADRARKSFDMSTADGKMAGLKFLLPAVQRIHNPIERATVAEEVAAYLGIERGIVLDSFRKSAGNRDLPARRPITPEIPLRERILVHALLANPDWRNTYTPRLRELTSIGSCITGRILHAIFELHNQNSRFEFSELEQKLAPDQQALLSSTVFADNSEVGGLTDEQVEALAGVFEREECESQLIHLRARLKAAERSGDLQAAFALMGEIDALRGRTG